MTNPRPLVRKTGDALVRLKPHEISKEKRPLIVMYGEKPMQ
jgi:hypothetical protein